MRIASMSALALSAVALCSVGPVGAGTNQFTLIGPDGGFIHRVEFHPTLPGVAFAVTSGGYYRTTDAGLHWQLVGANLNLQFAPEDLAIDPSDPRRVLVAVPGSAPLVSTDAGATLALVGNFPLAAAGLRHVEFSADGSVVYGSSDNRIVRSTDGGRTWSVRTTVTANATSTLQFLRVDPLDPNIVYVYDLNQGGFRSVDGGGSWQPVALPANTSDVAITSTTPQSIWAATATGLHRSTDGGATFPHVFPGVPLTTLAIALDPLNQATVYVSTSDGVFYSPDGNGWANVTSGTPVGLINSIAVNPLAPTTLMLGGTYGVFAGTPATMGVGGDWEHRVQGILAANAGAMSAAAGRIYVGTSNAGVHFLADGVTGTAPVDNEELQLLQSHPSQATTFGLLAQARSTDRLFVGISGGYARSDDGGVSWNLGNIGGDTATHFADSPADPDLILAATPDALRRSTDGGDTWLPAITGLPAQAQISALMFSSASPNVVYAGTQAHGVYQSTDGGASWSAANAGFETKGIRALAIDPTNADVVYAAAHPDLLKSTDGGASWSRLDAPTTFGGTLAVATDPDVPGIVCAAGFNNFARSVDAGATWQALRAEDARPEWVVNALLADPRRAGTLLASSIRHGVAEITVAPDLALESRVAPVTPVGIGVPATYRYRLRNAGAFHATGARIVVTLPTGAAGITATTSEGACVVQALTVTCTTPVIETGTSADIDVTSAHPAAGTLEVLASVNGDQSDPQSQNNQVRHTIDVRQLADMAGTVTGPLAASTNSTVTYTYTVTNNGPNEASGATASITLANGMISPSATTTRGTCAIAGQAVNCTLGNVPNGASTTITVTASTPATGGSLQTVGRAETTATDAVLANNETTISTTVSAPPPSGGSGGGGGGGGGTSSLFWLLALAVLRIARSYARPRRFRISGVGPSNCAIGTLPTYFRSRKPTGVV